MRDRLHKTWNACPVGLVVLFLVFFVNPVIAEIYKCEGAKNKIAYSDTPCHSSSTQTVTNIQANLDSSQNSTAPAVETKPAVMRQLDYAVKAAIADGNFIRADALALTWEQREWIALARKEAAENVAAGRSEADFMAELSNSAECAEAKNNLEKEAGSSFRKSDVLAAKTSLMYASCGIKNENSGYAGPAYAGGYGSFLYAPYPYYSYKKPGYRSHGQRPVRPVAYSPRGHNRHINRYSARDGFSLRINVGGK